MFHNLDGLFHTGTRVFAGISRIDLWHTESQALLYLDGGDRRVVLAEDESRIVRHWAELSLQAATNDCQDMAIRRRCDLLEQRRRAEKLNRKKTAPRRKLAPVLAFARVANQSE